MDTQSILMIKMICGLVVIIASITLLAYGGINNKSQLLFPSILMAGVGAWLISGGQIKFSPTSFEAKADSFAELGRVINAKSSNSTDLDVLSARYENGVKVWWQLLQYRIELRTTLRAICKDLNIELNGPDTSFTELLSNVKKTA